MSAECMVLLGGSFDPVHVGHVAVAEYFCRLFQTSRLCLIPAGNPWQKAPLFATSAQRIDMLGIAFGSSSLFITIDHRETENANPGYAVDTLLSIRKELGSHLCLVFVIGADQLLNLDTWHKWERLFDLAHIAVCPRPGYVITPETLPEAVSAAFFARLASPETIRKTPYGLCYLAEKPGMDICATEIRKAIRLVKTHHPLVPPGVLDYIRKNNIYRD